MRSLQLRNRLQEALIKSTIFHQNFTVNQPNPSLS